MEFSKIQCNHSVYINKLSKFNLKETISREMLNDLTFLDTAMIVDNTVVFEDYQKIVVYKLIDTDEYGYINLEFCSYADKKVVV